jgi:hypothetical protein
MRLTKLAFFACLTLATACGRQSDGKNDRTGKAGGHADLAELQANPPQAVPALISAFGLQEGSVGGLIAFYTGDRYFSGVAQQLSAAHYRIMATIGYYAEDGRRITTTRKRTTCRSHVVAHPAAPTIAGSTTSASLVLTSGATSAVATRISVTQPTARGFVVEWGCFDERTGAFVSEAWSDVE